MADFTIKVCDLCGKKTRHAVLSYTRGDGVLRPNCSSYDPCNWEWIEQNGDFRWLAERGEMTNKNT